MNRELNSLLHSSVARVLFQGVRSAESIEGDKSESWSATQITTTGQVGIVYTSDRFDFTVVFENIEDLTVGNPVRVPGEVIDQVYYALGLERVAEPPENVSRTLPDGPTNSALKSAAESYHSLLRVNSPRNGAASPAALRAATLALLENFSKLYRKSGTNWFLDLSRGPARG